MSLEEDPEVLDDLRKREESEHDPERTRRPTQAFEKSRVVGQWKCRNPACQQFIEVTEFTMEIWAMCNNWLRNRNEPVLQQNQVLVCEVCLLEFNSYRAKRLREKTDELAGVIRQLKQSQNPRGERELIARLEKLRHPEIGALLNALDAKPKRGDKRL